MYVDGCFTCLSLLLYHFFYLNLFTVRTQFTIPKLVLLTIQYYYTYTTYNTNTNLKSVVYCTVYISLRQSPILARDVHLSRSAWFDEYFSPLEWIGIKTG